MKKLVAVFFIFFPLFLNATEQYSEACGQTLMVVAIQNFSIDTICWNTEFHLNKYDFIETAALDWAATSKKSIGGYNPAQVPPAYNFQKVEKRTLTAIGLILVGIPLAVYGASNSDAAFYVGGTAFVAGCTIALTGGYQVFEPGYAMRSEAITLPAAESGFGLALNF